AHRGVLVPGALADLTLLDRDLAGIAPDGLPAVSARLTICDGQITHGSDAVAGALRQAEEG
ncbi:hypothetical protein EN741_22020, partial [Mesorhizobium sp. M4B.F.Ca.ET.019.03.1.1]